MNRDMTVPALIVLAVVVVVLAVSPDARQVAITSSKAILLALASIFARRRIGID